MAVKRIQNVYDVTQRLLGEIEPQGESNIDIARLENLNQTIELTEQFINDIFLVARHKDRPENSMKVAGKKADEFRRYLKELLSS